MMIFTASSGKTSPVKRFTIATFTTNGVKIQVREYFTLTRYFCVFSEKLSDFYRKKEKIPLTIDTSW